MKDKPKLSKLKGILSSFKGKLILEGCILMIVLCLGLTLVGYYYAQKSLNESINESLTKLSLEAAQNVDQKIESYFTELTVLASNDVFKDPLANTAPISALMKNNMFVTDTTTMLLLDTSGNTICSTTGTAINYADRDYFKASVAGKKFISDPIVSKVDGSMILIVSVPVKDASGRIIAVLCAAKDANALSDYIADVTYAKTGYAYMLSKDGIIIAHPTKDKVLAAEHAITDPNKQQDLAALVEKMTKGENGVGKYTYSGVTKYMGYAPLTNASWSLAVTAPQTEVFSTLYALRNMLLIIGFVFVIIGIIIFYIISNSIVNPIKTAVGYANTMASGDFTNDIDENFIKRKDEFGSLAKAFLKMSNSLDRTLSNIKAAAEQVAAGSHQVSDSSITLSQGATEQASSVQQLSASIEEISAQTKQNAENAQQANNLAIKTKTNADNGNEHMQDMLKAMEGINVSSNNIFKIIKVIEDIAFQTNILALNAAVEAARAGQHGKGFAVVAEEVRSLAARSSKAAQETTEMIQDSIKKVEGGSKIAEETSKALNEIVDEIDKVATLVEDIANASNEQAIGIGQVNEGIMQISAVVESNSAVAEESAASSEELAGQAQLLNKQISEFKLRNKKYVESLKDASKNNDDDFGLVDNSNSKY